MNCIVLSCNYKQNRVTANPCKRENGKEKQRINKPSLNKEHKSLNREFLSVSTSDGSSKEIKPQDEGEVHTSVYVSNRPHTTVLSSVALYPSMHKRSSLQEAARFTIRHGSTTLAAGRVAARQLSKARSRRLTGLFLVRRRDPRDRRRVAASSGNHEAYRQAV